MKHLCDMTEVVCGIIYNPKGEVLLCQRSADMKHAGKWEFPGGKVHAGENYFEALIREIKEELDIVVQPFKTGLSVDIEVKEKKLRLLPVLANFISGEIKLIEHQDFVWATSKDVLQFDLLEGDVLLWKNLEKDIS